MTTPFSYLGGVHMADFKNKLSKEYVKWRYPTDTVPKFARIGAKIGFGLMCLIAAFFFFKL